MQLRKYRLSFSRINQIFISHMHGDHVFGLPGLISTMHLLGRKHALSVFGPSELRQYLDQYISLFGRDMEFDIHFFPVGHRGKTLVFEDRAIEVFSIPLKHRIPTTGFLFVEKAPGLNMDKDALERYRPGIEQIARIKEGEDLILPDGRVIPNSELTLPPYRRRSYAYISDTAFTEKAASLTGRVDLLYHEATFASKDNELAQLTHHSTAVDAARFARISGARKLLLGHFSSRYKDPQVLQDEARQEFAESYLVHDGDSYEILREREGENPDLYE